MPRTDRPSRRHPQRLARFFAAWACVLAPGAGLAGDDFSAVPPLPAPPEAETVAPSPPIRVAERPWKSHTQPDGGSYVESVPPGAGGDPFAPDAGEDSQDRPLRPENDSLRPEPSDTAPGDAASPSVPDPFSRPAGETLRSLSAIRVALDTPAEGKAAEGRLGPQRPVTLAPHSWPTVTPAGTQFVFYHSPLWYEDANLERCGYTHGCLQPLVSGAYFLGNTTLLPYRFAAEPQCSIVPAKPFCPPGCRYSFRDNYLPPPSARGAAAEAVAVTGLIFLIP